MTKCEPDFESERLAADLLQAKQRLQHVTLSSPAVLFTVAFTDDKLDRITWASENVQRLLGYSHQATLGKEWLFASMHPEDRDRVEASLNRLLDLGQLTEEYRIRHADGNYGWTRCELRVIRDETAGSVEAIGALLNITEQKRSEEQEMKLRSQLQQAQRMESISMLAAGVAHGFNNLLTVMNGYCDIALAELRPGTSIQQNIFEVRMAGERAAALSRQLLILSRRQVVQPIQLNLNDLVGEIERMLSSVIGEDIYLKTALNPSLGLVLVDSGLMRQMLLNLVANARDAMPQGGILFVETDNVELGESHSHLDTSISPGPYVRLAVSDTGTGMTEEVKSRIFEPFFTIKGAGEGTGLRLATVSGIVKQSGGAISVYSEPGQGTKFSIYLPRLQRWAIRTTEAVKA